MHFLSREGTNSPETPAGVRRLATPLALLNLAKEAVVAIIISQIEALLGVLVLDFELCFAKIGVLGLGAHPLRLARRETSSKHAILLVACISDPSLGLFFVPAVAPDEAASHRDFCVDGGDHGEGDTDGDLHRERVMEMKLRGSLRGVWRM